MSDREPTPRWVKIFGLVALAVLVLLVVVALTGRGGHGPSRHGVADDLTAASLIRR